MKKIVFTFLILMVFILSSCTGLEARAFAKELQRGFESRMDFSGVTHSSNLQGTEEDETMSFTVNNKGYYYTETDEEVKSANLEYEYVYKKIENKLYLFKSFLRDESDYSPDFSKVLVDLMDRYKVISIEEGIYDKNSVYILTLEANNGNKQVYYVEKETYLVLKENYFLSEETCKFLNNFMLENNIDFSNTNCLLKSNYLTDIKINTGITDDFFDLRTQFPDAEIEENALREQVTGTFSSCVNNHRRLEEADFEVVIPTYLPEGFEFLFVPEDISEDLEREERSPMKNPCPESAVISRYSNFQKTESQGFEYEVVNFRTMRSIEESSCTGCGFEFSESTSPILILGSVIQLSNNNAEYKVEDLNIKGTKVTLIENKWYQTFFWDNNKVYFWLNVQKPLTEAVNMVNIDGDDVASPINVDKSRHYVSKEEAIKIIESTI